MNTYILVFLHAIIFSWAFYNILYFGSKPSKSIGWILTVLFIPFIGAFIFLIVGINRRRLKFLELKEIKRRRKRQRYSFDQLEYEKSNELESQKAVKISRMIYNNTYKPVYSNNSLEIIKSGIETFDKIYEALEEAKEFIHIQYYIIENGVIFDKMCEIFERKRKENVEIRILYDAFGSYHLKTSRKKKLRSLGVEIHPIMPLKWGKFLFTFNYRNHRKICIVDNKIGFTGGVNISNFYTDNNTELGIWKDSHVSIKGEAVFSLHKTFLEDYYFATSVDLSGDKKYNTSYQGNGNSKIQIVASGPDSDESVVMQQYLSLINSAEHSICIFNPYFIPTSSILESLKIASLSGVNVSLLLPKKGDSKITSYGMYSYFEELLHCGVHIYLRDDFSHSKVIFIDNEISSVGSTNFDCRSFEHNYEVNALIFNKNATKIIREEFDKRCKQATKLDLETFRNRSNKQKTLERLSRFLSPLL